MKVRAIIAKLRKLNKMRRGQPPYDRVGTEMPFSSREIGYLIDEAIEALDPKPDSHPSKKTTRKGRKP